MSVTHKASLLWANDNGNGATVTTQAGSNICLLYFYWAFWLYGFPSYPSAVSWDGNAFTHINVWADNNWHCAFSVWRYVGPAIKAGTLSVTCGGNTTARCGSVEEFEGVDQVTPIGASTVNNANSANPNITFSGATGDMGIGHGVIMGPRSLSYGAGEDVIRKGTSGALTFWNVRKAGASSVVISDTSDGGDHWGMLGFCLKAIAGGGLFVPKSVTF